MDLAEEKTEVVYSALNRRLRILIPQETYSLPRICVSFLFHPKW